MYVTDGPSPKAAAPAEAAESRAEIVPGVSVQPSISTRPPGGPANGVTVTEKDFDDEFPTASDAVQVTVVVPTAKLPPVRVPTLQLSVRLAAASVASVAETGIG